MRPTFDLLAITPPCGEVDPQVVRAWRDGGATPQRLALLLRTPGESPEATLARLTPVHREARREGFAVLLSSNRACEARWLERHDLAGLQLRGDPTSAATAEARALLGAHMLGASCHGPPRPVDPSLDYTCFAPVFPPRTPSAVTKVAAGLEPLAGWARERRVIALGGISPVNAGLCLHAGAAGLASITTFFGPAPRVAQDVRSLVEALDHAATATRRR